MSFDLLFKERSLFAMMISNFLAKPHKLHPFGGVLVIFGFPQHAPLDVAADVLTSFRAQTCFDNDVQ